MKSRFQLFVPLVLGVSIVGYSCSVQAQNQPKTPANSSAEANKLEVVRAGELRLDGKITGLLGVNRWSIEAISFTSPSGGSKEFDEPRTKSVVLAPSVVIHPVGEAERVAVAQIKVGSRVAVIGTNRADGSLLAREVILLEGYGKRRTVGTLSINPASSALINQSRKLRERGQMGAALEAAQKAVDTARALSDQTGEILSTQDLTLIYLDTQEYGKALEGANRVETLGRHLGNEIGIVLGLANKAAALRATGKFEEAVRTLAEATPLAARVDADIYRRMLSNRAMILLFALNRKDEGLGVISVLAQAQAGAGLAGEALQSRLIEAALRLPEAQGNARATAASAPKIIEAETKPSEKAQTQLYLGALLWRLGDQTEAQKWFALAQKGFEDLQDTQSAENAARAASALAAGTEESYFDAVFGPKVLAQLKGEEPEETAD